jgi:hypothetical protein
VAEIGVNKRSLRVVKKLRGTLSGKGGVVDSRGEDAVGSQGLSDR